MGIETENHLFQPPQFQGASGSWTATFNEACNGDSPLHWNVGAIMSTIALGYPLGDSTIIQEIRRQPWLSTVNDNGSCFLSAIPKHGLYWDTPANLARRLFSLLCDELANAAQPYRTVYVLLSGGLDSRIVAGATRRLVDEGRINANVIAVTWGLADSRDVHYGKMLAKTLGFEWLHAALRPDHFRRNITLAARALGAAVSPIHLHRMDWFDRHAEPNSLVLAASYGDSVGRSEFSRRTVLELLPIRPFNYQNLLTAKAAAAAEFSLQQVQRDFLLRGGVNEAQYVLRELEQQGHYMRGLIAHTMSVINQSERCHVYQAFTSPETFGFMWSLHPSARTDRIYMEILEILGGDLARVPWARSNRSMQGDTSLAANHLRADYHQYREWACAELQQVMTDSSIESLLDEFATFGIFDLNNLAQFFHGFSPAGYAFHSHGSQAYGAMAWFLALRELRHHLQIDILPPTLDEVPNHSAITSGRSAARRHLSNVPSLRLLAGTIRRHFYRFRAVLQYPPLGPPP